MKDLPRDTRLEASLAASELATNAVLYARTDFDVSVERLDKSIFITVTDRGGGTPRALDPPSPRDKHGRGLLIVQGLVDDWGVTNSEGVTEVWCRIPIRRDVNAVR